MGVESSPEVQEEKRRMVETEWSYKARYTLNPTGKQDHMLVDGRGTITLAHLVNAEHKGRRGQEKQNIKKNAGSGKGENGLVTYEATKAITKGTQLITVYGGTHMRGDGFKEPASRQKGKRSGERVTGYRMARSGGKKT